MNGLSNDKSQILQGVYSFCGNGVSYGGKLVSGVDSCIKIRSYICEMNK